MYRELNPCRRWTDVEANNFPDQSFIDKVVAELVELSARPSMNLQCPDDISAIDVLTNTKHSTEYHLRVDGFDE